MTLPHCTAILDVVLLVNCMATCYENDRILLKVAVDMVPTIICNDSIGPVWTITETCTTSSLSILLHGIISLPDATSYDKYV